MTSQVDFKISRKDDALAAKGETGAQISPDQVSKGLGFREQGFSDLGRSSGGSCGSIRRIPSTSRGL